ncbi:hypothetical protein GCM10010405_30900 [Streptomyces macrosporus]|uniref:Uncharacterized protein n=1 Tax=Streptomyces macrosporus TaxID=44032 RepID=A0ABP5X4S5_9ACTN
MNREYMRWKPERPVPGREPWRHCTGLAAFRPAAMTSSFTDRAEVGYFGTGGRPVPEYGSHTGTASPGWADRVVEIPTT